MEKKRGTSRPALRALGGIAAAAAAIVAVTVPSPAQAAPGGVTAASSSCPASYLCFWVDENQGGARGKVSGTNANWANFSQSQCQSGTWDNCASSLENAGTSCNAVLWSNPDYTGPQLWIGRGVYISNLQDRHDNLAPFLEDWGDRISSNSWQC